MANAVKIKFNKKALEQLRNLPSVRKDLYDRATRIADKASDGGRVGGYKVTDLVLEDPRGASSVMATGHAANHNRRTNALMKALDAGR